MVKVKNRTLIFEATLDRISKIVTIAIITLFVIIAVINISAYNASGSVLSLLGSVLIFFILVGTYLLSPVKYQLNDEYFIIRRPIGSVAIKRKNIKQIQLVNNTQIRRSIRTFGVGGVFGYFGKFSSYKTGSMSWYATRLDKGVLIETIDNKKILVTPDEPDELVEQLATSLH